MSCNNFQFFSFFTLSVFTLLLLFSCFLIFQLSFSFVGANAICASFGRRDGNHCYQGREQKARYGSGPTSFSVKRVFRSHGSSRSKPQPLPRTSQFRSGRVKTRNAVSIVMILLMEISLRPAKARKPLIRRPFVRVLQRTAPVP